jgi:trehalose 6-phosphate phosphatase
LADQLDNFFNSLSQTDSRLLFLDYDGTLAPFRKERDKAIPYEGVEERLDRIILLGKTDIVIISGRAIEDLKPLLKLKRYPEIWGSHGRERLTASGEYLLQKPDNRSARGLSRATKFILDNNLNEFMESKPTSIAIHFRGAEPEKTLEIRAKIVDNWSRLGVEYNLELAEFDGGIELKTVGVDKGTAVKEVFSGYSSRTVGAYLGDDLTDEDAFKALPATAIGILVREKERKTAASLWIKPPEELLEFLDRWTAIDEKD